MQEMNRALLAIVPNEFIEREEWKGPYGYTVALFVAKRSEDITKTAKSIKPEDLINNWHPVWALPTFEDVKKHAYWILTSIIDLQHDYAKQLEFETRALLTEIEIDTILALANGSIYGDSREG